VFSVPLEYKEGQTNLEVLETLNIDFWKFEIKEAKNGFYQPSDYLTKKKKIFKMSKLMKDVVATNPLYYFYLGSLTTPPCDEFVNHMVASKPLMISNCQLKVLRENSLATDHAQQIHSRMQKTTQRKKNPSSEVSKNTSASGSGYSDSDGLGKGAGNGAGNGFAGKRGVFAISKIFFDSNLGLWVDKDLRKDRLLPKKGVFEFKKGFKDTDDELNC